MNYERWREAETRDHSSIVREIYYYCSRGLMVRAGIMLYGHTTLQDFERDTVNGVWYRYTVLEPYVCNFRSTVGLHFILMDGNVRSHRAHVVGDFLESEDICQMISLSLDRSLVKHVWGTFQQSSWRAVLLQSPSKNHSGPK